MGVSRRFVHKHPQFFSYYQRLASSSVAEILPPTTVSTLQVVGLRSRLCAKHTYIRFLNTFESRTQYTFFSLSVFTRPKSLEEEITGATKVIHCLRQCDMNLGWLDGGKTPKEDVKVITPSAGIRCVEK
jgi:hypothetical protein